MLKINEQITELHFQGTFMFPHDLDFLGETTKVQFFVDVFNEMIQKRLLDNAKDAKLHKPLQ